MKQIAILIIFCILILPSCSYGEEPNKGAIIPNDSLLKLEGEWEAVGFEGKDVKSYKEVIERVVIKFEKDGNFSMTITYKKDVLIQFEGIQEMSPDGKVTTTGNLVMKDNAIKMIAKGHENDVSTVLFRNGNLLTKDDDEDAIFVFKKIPRLRKQ